jgi:hypothetical protein
MIALNDTLALHAAWLRGDSTGARAPLSSVKLSGANLRSANLSGANLSGADIRGADLSGADIRDANLSGADLSRAKLSGANLRIANLCSANLCGANLIDADLRSANLCSANLNNADLSGANLSGARGLLVAADWLGQFERDALGVIVYKAVGDTEFSPRPNWTIAPGEILAENVNCTRTQLCGCGVNFGTRMYVLAHYPPREGREVWRCRIAWIDLADVCVPYNTDGKARCARLTLLEVVS